MDDCSSEIRTRRRIEPMSGLIGLATIAALLGTAWLRFGPSSSPEPRAAVVGAEAPRLRLRDLNTSEPLVLVGLQRKVLWVVFWSAAAPGGRSCLPELQAVWGRLRAHRRFAFVTAAVEAEEPERVRRAVDEAGVELPVYLASHETQRQFGAGSGDPPLHVLIDADGRIVTLARGGDRPTIQRIAGQIQTLLDEIRPLEDARFALALAPGLSR
jgi:hypothetical protein